MPEHAEYVIATYGIFIATFGGYIALLYKKSGRSRAASRQLKKNTPNPR